MGVVTNEIKIAGIEANFAGVMTSISSMATAINGKVDKVEGKGLSENDFTDTEKAIVDGVTAALSLKLNVASVELTSADDLNDIKTNGLYAASTAPANTPDSRSYYSMLVIAHNASDLCQIIFTSNAIYTRKFTGFSPAWGAWTKYTGTTLT